MKKLVMRFIPAVISLPLLLSPAVSSAQVRQQETMETETKKSRSLLWEISGNGLKKPSYVFGTIHIIGSNDFFFPPVFEEKLLASKTLVMEVNMQDVVGQLRMLNLMMMDSNRTLEDLYAKEDLDLIREVALDSFGVNIDLYKTMKPVFLQQIMSTQTLGKETRSYEMHLLGLAKDNHLKIAGLETIEEQMTILDSIPLRTQAKILLESLQDIPEDRRIMRRMVQLYKDQDTDSLRMFFVDQKEMSAFEGSLIDHRNSKWIPKIEDLMQKKPAFIAVGAGHLGGEKGVLELLRKKGYTVSAVK